MATLLEVSLLRSPFGRRLVALFVLSALAPLAIAAVFLFRDFDRSLRRQQQQAVDQDVRLFGMALMTRMVGADDVLGAVITSKRSANSDRADLVDAIARLPWAAAVHVASQDASCLETPPSQIPDAAAPAVLMWRRNADLPQLFLVRRLAGTDCLSVEVASSWLWEDASSYAVDGALAVDTDAAGRVFGTAAQVDSSDRPMQAKWTLFVPSHFAGEPWHLRLSRPRTSTLAALQTTEVAFPAIVVLATLTVTLLAIGVIRRQLRPLRELVAGTGRIARRDFSAPIHIEGNDEFRQLAQSFNDMTVELGQQFDALEALSEVDRLLLRSPSVEDVFDALLPRICTVVGCQSVTVLLVDSDAIDHLRAYDYCRRHNTAPRPVRRVAMAVEPLQVACARGTLTIDAQTEALIKPMAEIGVRHFLARAVTTDDGLSGILLIGFENDSEAQRQRIVDPSEFAARLSVALNKIEQTNRLQYQAQFDALTGLANRRLFLERLADELTQGAEHARKGAVLYIDLDHFKRINDTEGHGAGDQLLCVIARRLKDGVGQAGLVARLGGDEFAALLPGMHDVDALRQLAQQLLKAVAEHVLLGNRQRAASASIGVALYPDDASTTEGLMMLSDVAMYRAKDLGRGQAVFFKAEMQARLEAIAAIETGLRRALSNNELRVLYQPIICVGEGRLQGAEALVRWPNESGKPVHTPSQFIPVAEETGLIAELGAWVLRAACQQFQVWRREGMVLDYVSVNLSVRQLADPQLVDSVLECLAQSGMTPSELQLEITESVLADAAISGKTIEALALAGIRLALDDFGTGFSSLSYLRHYPIGTIKIDQSFVRSLPWDAKACGLVEAMIAMARAVGHSVVAEGVETAEQRNYLVSVGCDSQQGYLLGRPMPGKELAGFVAPSSQPTSVSRVPML